MNLTMCSRNRILLSTLLVCGLMLACALGPASGQQLGASTHTILESTYPVTVKPSEIVLSPVKLSVLATQLQTDISTYMSYFRVQDPETLVKINQTLGEIATIQGDYSGALLDFNKAKASARKPVEKMTTCLVEIALAKTYQDSGTDFGTTLGTNLDTLLSPLPFADVEGYLKANAGSFEMLSAVIEQGRIASVIDPSVTQGRISLEAAENVIAAGYVVQFLVPYQAKIAASFQKALDSNATPASAEIWSSRGVSFDSSIQLTPVVVGIWDSGTDISLFKDKLYENPNAGMDGYGDDEHGAAWDDKSDITTGLLYPISETPDQVAVSQEYLAGFSDASSNVDSSASIALRKKISELTSDEIQPFLEQINLFENYCHGTAVTGIAVDGNPAARIEVCRLTYDYRLLPDMPTIETAAKDGNSKLAQVHFLVSHGARVVNMSWESTLAGIENSLVFHHSPGSKNDVLNIAKKIYDLSSGDLLKAMKSANNILFVVAAGNDGSDVTDNEVYPASFKLRNMIDVGAVDQSGEQTSFTNTSNVDVYADGYQVPCLIPGGKTVQLSGTSMAAPAVTNLAAKILAINPDLTPEQIKQLIIDNCDTNIENGAAIKLINPKRTIAATQLLSSKTN